MTIAFDVDDTLWKVRARKVRDGDCVFGCEHNQHYCDNYRFDQVPNYDLIQVLRWFFNNGDKVVVWSAGGVEYAQRIVEKLGLDSMVTVVDKHMTENVDISFDDMEVNLAKANVRVRR